MRSPSLTAVNTQDLQVFYSCVIDLYLGGVDPILQAISMLRGHVFFLVFAVGAEAGRGILHLGA